MMVQRYVGFFGLLLLAQVTVGYSSEIQEQNRRGILLPKDLRPLHYLIRLQPYVNGNFTFDGFVEITFKVVASTREIYLHMKDIVTKNETAEVHLKDFGDSKQILNQTYDVERDFYVAYLGSSLEVGKVYVISLNFRGYLNDRLKGFYRSSYEDENGATRFLATTQFAAIDARRAFPCFDEPAFRSEFTIEIVREERMMAISNMPKESSTPIEDQTGWMVDRFETTVPMSTYLVAFIVSDFDFVVSEKISKYQFRVMARRNVLDQAEYALEIGPKIISFYEEFFEVPYPLPKMDMAAIPDFPFGGMENWGLITYRESTLLYDKGQTDVLAKRKASLVVSHELAHQWFGNLVTPTWWTDIWLNEGFASYVEYLGMNAVDPSQKFLDQIVILDLHKAFSQDCIESSHPISIPVRHPDQINEIFDTITYQKGASIIRMMSHFLTEETFRTALKNYLRELSYDNAEQDDLWEYMTEQAHKDGTIPVSMTVKEVMDTWTLQMGFPVLTIQRNSIGAVLLTQERFLMSKNLSSTDTHDYKWWIPITMSSSSNPDFTQTKPTDWMMPTEAEKTLEGTPGEDDWMVFNVKSVGYFRVNYDMDNWKALSQQLKDRNEAIDSVNRAQILDDALNLARAGYLSYDIALDVLSYIKSEQEYVPLAAALTNMNYLSQMFSNFDQNALLEEFFRGLLLPHYSNLGFKDSPEDHELTQFRRIDVVNWACQLGHQECIDQSVSLFAQWMGNPENTSIISPNLKSTVYCTAIGEGGKAEWDYAWAFYEKTEIGSEKVLLLNSLACSSDQQTLRSFLERTIDPNGGIRKQDVKSVILSVAEGHSGRTVAWQFVRERWDDIVSYFGSSLFTLTSIVESVTKHLNTEAEIKQLREFKEAHEGRFLSAARAVEQAEETVRININWIDRYYTPIVHWLKEKGHKKEETDEEETTSGNSRATIARLSAAQHLMIISSALYMLML